MLIIKDMKNIDTCLEKKINIPNLIPMCMYVYAYVYIYMHACVYMYICLYVCIYVYVCEFYV